MWDGSDTTGSGRPWWHHLPATLVVAGALVATALSTAGHPSPITVLPPVDPVSTLPLPTLRITPTSGPAGTGVTMTGTGFVRVVGPTGCDEPVPTPDGTGYLVCVAGPEAVRGEPVLLTMERAGTSTPLFVTSSDATGAFQATVTIPPGTPSGVVQLVARGDSGTGPAAQAFTVTATVVVAAPRLTG